MSNRSLSAPDFVASKGCVTCNCVTLRYATNSFFRHYRSLPQSFDEKSVDETGLLVVNERGYICMPSWLTVTCVFVLESLLEEPGFAMVAMAPRWTMNGTDVGSIDDRRESVYHIVSYCTFVYLLFAFFKCVDVIADSKISSVKFSSDVFCFNVVN